MDGVRAIDFLEFLRIHPGGIQSVATDDKGLSWILLEHINTQ